MVQAKMAAALQGDGSVERGSHGTVPGEAELGLPLGEAALAADHAAAPCDGVGAPGAAPDHGAGLLVDNDRAGVRANGLADFLKGYMARPCTNTGVLVSDMGAPYTNTGVLARDMAAPDAGLGAPNSIAVVFARDMAARYSSGGVLAREHGVPFETKAQGMVAAGAPPAPQVSHLNSAPPFVSVQYTVHYQETRFNYSIRSGFH